MIIPDSMLGLCSISIRFASLLIYAYMLPGGGGISAHEPRAGFGPDGLEASVQGSPEVNIDDWGLEED